MTESFCLQILVLHAPAKSINRKRYRACVRSGRINWAFHGWLGSACHCRAPLRVRALRVHSSCSQGALSVSSGCTHRAVNVRSGYLSVCSTVAIHLKPLEKVSDTVFYRKSTMAAIANNSKTLKNLLQNQEIVRLSNWIDFIGHKLIKHMTTITWQKFIMQSFI